MTLCSVSNLCFCNIAYITHNSDGHGLFFFLSRILTICLYSDCNGFIVGAKVRDQTDTVCDVGQNHGMHQHFCSRQGPVISDMSKITKLIFYSLTDLIDV